MLSEEAIQQVADDVGVSRGQDDDGVVYTMAVTLWAFLSQVLFSKEQRSCRAAVARVIVLCVALGKEPCADNTGAYCRARARLPLVLIQRLTYHLADAAEASVPDVIPLHEAPRTDVAPARPGVIHQHWSEPVNGQRAEAMNEGVMIERRSGQDRRVHPLGSALFAGPERRAGVFGRRPVDTYDTNGRK